MCVGRTMVSLDSCPLQHRWHLSCDNHNRSGSHTAASSSTTFVQWWNTAAVAVDDVVAVAADGASGLRDRGRQLVSIPWRVHQVFYYLSCLWDSMVVVAAAAVGHWFGPQSMAVPNLGHILWQLYLLTSL